VCDVKCTTETRNISCYENIHGLLLVHDLSNKKSYNNLKKWITELSKSVSLNAPSGILEMASYSLNGIPVLIIGNKFDTVKKQVLDIDDEMGREEIHLSAHDPKTFASGSHPSKVVSEFLDKVISKQYSQHVLHRNSTTSLHSVPTNLSIKPPRNPRIEEDVLRSTTNENLKIT